MIRIEYWILYLHTGCSTRDIQGHNIIFCICILVAQPGIYRVRLQVITFSEFISLTERGGGMVKSRIFYPRNRMPLEVQLLCN